VVVAPYRGAAMAGPMLLAGSAVVGVRRGDGAPPHPSCSTHVLHTTSQQPAAREEHPAKLYQTTSQVQPAVAMASILQQTSRLPQPAKAKVVAKSVNTRSRGILGDIKNVKNQDVQNEKNPPTKKLVLAGGKTRMTRQASRRLVPVAVEAKEDAALASTQERVLPPGVVDVDSKDASNPQLCAEYAAEMFAYLK